MHRLRSDDLETLEKEAEERISLAKAAKEIKKLQDLKWYFIYNSFYLYFYEKINIFIYDWILNLFTIILHFNLKATL